MTEKSNSKRYDLEDRTLAFAKRVVSFIHGVTHSISNVEIVKQLIRSAGSVGANHIEANESLGKKDFLFHIRISRKEAKETRYWLQLIEFPDTLKEEQTKFIQETTELMKIFGAILEKSR
jgi:four helix bundle protein